MLLRFRYFSRTLLKSVKEGFEQMNKYNILLCYHRRVFEQTTCVSYHAYLESIKLVLALQVHIHLHVSLAFDDTRKFNSHLIGSNAIDEKVNN